MYLIGVFHEASLCYPVVRNTPHSSMAVFFFFFFSAKDDPLEVI